MPAGGQHVLVVDDDPSLRLLCRVNLELDGYTVSEASGLDEARAALTGEGADAVLLDVRLGHASGLALLDELKRERPDLPVVLLTGDSSLAPDDRARADALLSKPFAVGDLAATLRRLLG